MHDSVPNPVIQTPKIIKPQPPTHSNPNSSFLTHSPSIRTKPYHLQTKFTNQTHPSTVCTKTIEPTHRLPVGIKPYAPPKPWRRTIDKGEVCGYVLIAQIFFVIVMSSSRGSARSFGQERVMDSSTRKRKSVTKKCRCGPLLLLTAWTDKN